MKYSLGCLVALLFVSLTSPAQAAQPGKPVKISKERLVLMPLRVAEEDKSLQGAMETALVEGLQQRYEVFSGEQVSQKAREIFMKESRNTAKKECDETRCMQGIAEAFQAELIATANVTKQSGGYFLALSIQNIFDNKVEHSKTLTCKGCDSFQVVDKLKELVGTPAPAVSAPAPEAPQPKVNVNDPDGALWAEAQKGNTVEDYQVYLNTYPKGKYVPFAKARIKKIKEVAQAAAEQQEQQAWDSAQQEGSEASYGLYLKSYPNGRFAGLARVRGDKLKDDAVAREEDALWQTVQASQDRKVVRSFIDKYPGSSHLAAAQTKLAAIKKAAAEVDRKEALNIEILGAGEHQIPIAIVPFLGEDLLDQSITEVVSNDLLRTGLFKLVDPDGKAPHQAAEVNYTDWTKVAALTIGNTVKLADGRIEIRFRLLDTGKKSQLLGLALAARSDQMRAIGHRIADMIYEKLTGIPGVFSTRIAYVNRQGKDNRLIIADSDGYGGQALLKSPQQIMSPAWSPDGSQLAYVSFERGHATVFVQSLTKQQRSILADLPGSNSAPAWSPDGQQLAVALIRDGVSHIYLVRPDGTDLRQITFGGAKDDEPNFSPDGQRLIFTSNRGGSVQIYRMPVNGGEAERLTSEGDGNFTPRYSQDGKSFVFSHWRDGRFYIAVKDFEAKQIQILTPGGLNKNPSFSPNGKVILFGTEVNGHGILGAVSRDGKVTNRMSRQESEIAEPAWGPFLKQ